MGPRLAFITDVHLDEGTLDPQGFDAKANWTRLLADVRSRGIRRVVFGGDIGEAESYPWFFDSLQDLELDLVLGNHDRYGDVTKFYRPEGIGAASGSDGDEMYCVREDDDFRYVFMDSSSATISETQFAWFQSVLHSPKNLVLFIHHPILAVATAVDRLFPLAGRDRLVAELQKRSRETTVFSGHYHLDDEQQVGKVRQIVTPAASFQIVKDADPVETCNQRFGYRILDLGQPAVSGTTRSRDLGTSVSLASATISTELVTFQRS